MMQVDKWDLLDKEGALQSDLVKFLFEREVKKSLRYQDLVTLLMIEPDRRPRAAEALGMLATIIQNNIRETDFMARINDAEFAILLLASKPDSAHIVASRIMDCIHNYLFPHEKAPRLTVSIGGACFPTTSASLEASDCLTEARNALAAAKKRGNSFYLISPSL